MSSETNWRAFYVKPRHEKKVKERLEEQHYEVYCPLFNTKVKWSDRWKKVQKPAIPGYIFAKVNEKERLEVLQDPAVLNTVFWNKKPAVIRDEEIETIRILLGEAEHVSIEPLSRGDKVQVEAGAFSGLDGTVVNMLNKTVRITLQSLQCDMVVTVPVERIRVLSRGKDASSLQ